MRNRGAHRSNIDTTLYYMASMRRPRITYDGQRLPRYYAVIPRIGASITAYGTARPAPVRNPRTF